MTSQMAETQQKELWIQVGVMVKSFCVCAWHTLCLNTYFSLSLSISSSSSLWWSQQLYQTVRSIFILVEKIKTKGLCEDEDSELLEKERYHLVCIFNLLHCRLLSRSSHQNARASLSPAPILPKLVGGGGGGGGCVVGSRQELRLNSRGILVPSFKNSGSTYSMSARLLPPRANKVCHECGTSDTPQWRKRTTSSGKSL